MEPLQAFGLAVRQISQQRLVEGARRRRGPGSARKDQPPTMSCSASYESMRQDTLGIFHRGRGARCSSIFRSISSQVSAISGSLSSRQRAARCQLVVAPLPLGGSHDGQASRESPAASARARDRPACPRPPPPPATTGSTACEARAAPPFEQVETCAEHRPARAQRAGKASSPSSRTIARGRLRSASARRPRHRSHHAPSASANRNRYPARKSAVAEAEPGPPRLRVGREHRLQPHAEHRGSSDAQRHDEKRRYATVASVGGAWSTIFMKNGAPNFLDSPQQRCGCGAGAETRSGALIQTKSSPNRGSARRPRC